MSRRCHRALARVAPGAVAATLALAAGCGSTSQEPAGIQNLDRPIDLAIACYGQMRITGGDGAQVTDPIEFQPHPVASCTQRTGPASSATNPDNALPGQEDLPGQPPLGPSMRWFMFTLQSASGTVAVAEAAVRGDGAGYNTGEVVVRDADLLVPGKNALSVGSQPVAIAGDPSGCFMMTANAGSCDLSVIDVDRIVERSREPLVRKQDVTTASGAPIRARPAAMIADASQHPMGEACPAAPQGLVYIAYPACNAVAVVDAGTGVAVASIRFDAAGDATLGDGELACPAECGGREPTVDAGRPVTLDLVRDDVSVVRRLAIGLDNRPVLTVVDLDPDFLPVAVEQVELEGDVGVIDVAITPVIEMTGQSGWPTSDVPNPQRAAQYVYAVATDATVRVAEVGSRDHECETQLDPRFIRDVADSRFFICLEPGQVGTPPRRAFARGPGIELPGDDAPLSVAITEAGRGKPAAETPSPDVLIGYFAFVSSSLGLTYVVNVDDDNYADTHNSTAPLLSQLALGLPHQLRDGIARRDGVATTTGDESPMGMPLCEFTGPVTQEGPQGGPRAQSAPTSFVSAQQIASNKGFHLPYIRQLHCRGSDGERAVAEVMYATPPVVRDDVFPDLRGLRFQEGWSFQWEGSLSLDSVTSAVDGPSIRSGQVAAGGGSVRVSDPARPYCAAGVERYDHLQLRGCDPAQGNRQCGLGEVCYVHPDATIANGACLPADQVSQLASLCRDFLVSVRRYAVQQATAGELVASERRHVLRTTPVTGCTSSAQCQELADYEATLTSRAHPVDDTTPPSERTWSCEPDPTRAPGIDRCQLVCTEQADCAEGTVCSGGYCLEGTIPHPACVAGLQCYSLHATEALVAIGDRTGYVHDVIAGPGGACVKDPDASPLAVGRIPLHPPPCTGDGVDDVTPNPCRTTVEHTELVPAYTPGTCNVTSTNGVLRTTVVDAVRWRNHVMTLNIVDPTYPGDAMCRHDRAGGRVGIPVAYPGFAFGFNLVAGFAPKTASGLAVFPSRVVRAPDNAIWIVDEGDIQPGATNVNTRGQLIRVDPDRLTDATFVR